MGSVWFIRMAKWARHPPSPGRVKLVFAVVALALAVVAAEHLGLWPDWAEAERKPLRIAPKPMPQPGPPAAPAAPQG